MFRTKFALLGKVLVCSISLCGVPVASAVPSRSVQSSQLADAVAAARQRAYGATAVAGTISAASHECVPLVIDCNHSGVGHITSHDCSTDGGVFVDFIFFSAVAGQTITADLSSPDFNPFLFLFDPDANIVAQDDDSGPFDSARIIHGIDETSDLWSLGATPLDPFVFGDYLLSLACTPAGPSVPAAPSSLTAQATSPTQVQLAWQDNSNNETSFRVELRPFGGSFSEIGSVGMNSTGVAIVDLTPGSTFDFRVRARNAAGNSGYSNVATATLPTISSGPCVPGPTTLCIDSAPGDKRFAVRVSYQTAQGGGSSGNASALALSSLGVNRGGLFTFFNPANPEMLLKVLDGCPVNDHFWVFFAATTNVGFEVTVTDTDTGLTWSRTNSDGTPAVPVQDTAAFATCP